MSEPLSAFIPAVPMAIRPVIDRELTRRSFLGRSAASVVAGFGSAAAVEGQARPLDDQSPVRIGVIGVRRRGLELAQGLAAVPGVEIGTLCDVDGAVRRQAQRELGLSAGQSPQVVADARRLFDDPSIGAVVIATPNHAHVPLAELACAAGKDVYLEVPVTHSSSEAVRLLDAAERSGCVIQCGLQQRSSPHFQSAIELLRSGGIGRVGFVRAWAVHRRGGMQSPARSGTKGQSRPTADEYMAWLGDAPRREFDPLRYHHQWRWFWDYGGGELANLGVHLLDVARWGLGVDLPDRVTAQGGRLDADSPWETPDTLNVQFEYPSATIAWEHRLWSDHGIEGRSAGVAFYGSRGTLVVDRGGWKVYGSPDGPSAAATPLLKPHLDDFIACVRTRTAPRAGLLTGCITSELCHLGNRAYQSGASVAGRDSCLWTA